MYNYFPIESIKSNCVWNTNGPPWKCQQCGWIYPINSNEPPRRVCSEPSKPQVGDRLHNLLCERLGVGMTVGCDCKKWIARMNEWGPKGCREEINAIVSALLAEARRRKWKLDGKPLLSVVARVGAMTPLGMSFARHWARNLITEAINSCEVAMKWAYGVTTTPSRVGDLLPQTLASLKEAGFPIPRLFVDNCQDPRLDYERFGLEVTNHWPQVRTYGNWVLAIWELYLRDCEADRYAIFQDDILAYKNLRLYLENSEYPRDGYCNLCTYPVNQALAKGHLGWYRSNRLGKGAQALVFDRGTVELLLAQKHLTERMLDPRKRHRAVDGAIVTALNKAKRLEYVHNPTLVDHVGLMSSMRNRPQPTNLESFLGRDYDALKLVPSPTRYEEG